MTAFEQRLAQFFFETSHLSGEWRLRNMQPLGCSCEVLFLSDRDEIGKLGEAHAERLSYQTFRSTTHPKKVLDSRHGGRQIGRVTIEILSPQEIDLMRAAGRVAAATLAATCDWLKPGASTGDIDDFVRADTQMRGGSPSQLGYHGFPAAVCTSRNHVVCHGIPRRDEVLGEGDIVNIDVTTQFDGFHGDTSRTVLVGECSPLARSLVSVAEQCMWRAIERMAPGVRLGDLGEAVCLTAWDAGFSVVSELGGHGIGRKMHQAPHVDYTNRPGRGIRLKEGMVITIEPMINAGGPGVEFLDDGWTVTTRDRSLSAQFEHTVLVTKLGFEVLTLPSQ